MTEKPTPRQADLYEAEEVAAEFLLHEGEAALDDRCDTPVWFSLNDSRPLASNRAGPRGARARVTGR